ncbi:MAG: flavin reductase family protein [Candidatus Dormibacterales bacterium]
MARVPAGVVVVAATTGPGRFRGMTLTSFASASLDPPLVVACVDHLAQTRDAVEESGRFAASVLSDRQEFLAERFAGRAPLVEASWGEVPHVIGASGLPILRGCVAWFECDLQSLVPAGDHDLAVGLVTAAGTGSGDPAVHWHRAFWRLTR